MTAPGSKPLSVNKILVYIIAVDKTDKNKDLSGKSSEFFEFYSDEVRLYCKLKQKALDAFNRKIQEGQALG